ncbi:MAG TPA: DUF1080 domain-containing protein [Chthonomonadales bacterium]|nr:DUF1080 domain-containing protein [Chthonomonadales bacterium]
MGIDTGRPKRYAARLAVALALGLVCLGFADALLAERRAGYSDLPFLPGGRWRVHDGARPQPRTVDPGAPAAESRRAPSDAVVLFDGSNTERWHRGDGQPTRWRIVDGSLVALGGGMVSRDEFGDAQIHIEFATPDPARGTGQDRGNSGVFMMGRYEVQVLDSYRSETYPDGQAAAIYGQYPPLVNASRPPGQWQTLDIIFEAPRFADGRLERPAYMTVFHNGVLVHHRAEVLGTGTHRALPRYEPHGPRGPLVLQDHGDPVRYRKIWVRELKGYDEP